MSQSWSSWWFLHGGSLHALRKNGSTEELADLANHLAREAWEHCQRENGVLQNLCDRFESTNDSLRSRLALAEKVVEAAREAVLLPRIAQTEALEQALTAYDAQAKP